MLVDQFCRRRTHILMLEQLCDTKEERGRLLAIERFPDIEKVNDLCEENAALAGADGRLVEYAGLLDNGGLVL